MTEKELGKLRRPDLLALLVAQGKESSSLQERLEESEQSFTQALQLDNRLRAKLDEKDEQIERLKARLNEKDEQIEHLKSRLEDKDRRLNVLAAQVDDLITDKFFSMENAHSLTEISVKLELMLRAAQKASDRYIRNLQKTV